MDTTVGFISSSDVLLFCQENEKLPLLGRATVWQNNGALSATWRAVSKSPPVFDSVADFERSCGNAAAAEFGTRGGAPVSNDAVLLLECGVVVRDTAPVLARVEALSTLLADAPLEDCARAASVEPRLLTLPAATAYARVVALRSACPDRYTDFAQFLLFDCPGLLLCSDAKAASFAKHVVANLGLRNALLPLVLRLVDASGAAEAETAAAALPYDGLQAAAKVLAVRFSRADRVADKRAKLCRKLEEKGWGA